MSVKVHRRRNAFGGFTHNKIARMLGLPNRRVLNYLQDTERKLGHPLTEADVALFIWAMIDARIRDEVKAKDTNYVNI